MRKRLVVLHRYAGLVLAGALFVAGITGSLIAFQQEIDRGLNPDLYRRASRGASLPLDALVAAVERQLEGVRVSSVYLERPGENVLVVVAGLAAGTQPPFNQVFADPATGRVLGTRLWGECCFERRNVVPFLYTVHHSLKLPGVWGVLFMGGIAMLWLLDCFVGFCLTLPSSWRNWRRWKTAWTLKPGARGIRLGLDLHRAGGLWLWGVLLVTASSGVAMNLDEQVFRPAVDLVAELSPTLVEQGIAAGAADTPERRLSFAAAVASARAQAASDLVAPVAHYVLYVPALNAYGVALTAKADAAAPLDGLGPSWIYLSGADGRVLARELAGRGTSGDVYLQSQFSLHSGRILGLPGRVLIAATGLVVAMLSVTGVYVWWRKRRARLGIKAA